MFARHHFTASLLLLLAASALAGARAADAALARRLKEAGQEFARKKSRAKEQAIKEFDTAISRVKSNSRLTAAARSDKLKELTSAREVFSSTERFPRDDAYAGTELKYYLAINKAFAPLAKLIDQAIAQGIRTGDKELEASALKLKDSLESQIVGTEKLTPDSLWRGTFQRGGETIPYHLRITKRGDATFKGHVEDHPGIAGNWAYDVEGQTSGLAVQFVMTRSVRGSFKAVKVDGIVSGDRLIGRVVQSSGPGRPTVGLIVLRRD